MESGEREAARDHAPRKGMTAAEIAETIEAILDEATLAEKVGMLSGQGFFTAFAEDGGTWGARPYRAGSGIERLGVPPLWFTDGPRGVARGNATCFPCSMARGASFDVALERRIGNVMGVEARAGGCTLSGAVCINLLRHPAWGRAQETYGEDPHHLGAMGAALGQGIQAHNVIATVKHFALNSMENARFTVDVQVDERTLHEVYLPHFKACLDAGISSVMSAYNKVNGEYCGQNANLLTDILRDEWGFTGFVHSDWIMGVYQVYGLAAGLDIENPEPLRWGEKLRGAVEAGHVAPEVVDRACRRILITQYRFACAEDPLPAYIEELVACEAHRQLAREAAEQSAVLLENDGTLPLDRAKVGKLAVLGRLAALVNTGDNGSSRVSAPYVVTALEGLQSYLGSEYIRNADETDIAKTRTAIDEADVIVVVAGYTAAEEGEFIPDDLTLGQQGAAADLPPELAAAREARPPRTRAIGGDRLSLNLPADQVALIRAAAEAGKPLVVVLVAGSAVMVEEWREGAGAILQTFYSGMEGGHALARLLFGEVSPSAKLPFTVARAAGDYPHFDRDAAEITYDHYHGYTLFEREGKSPRYPFGHGLSYTSFGYRGLKAERRGDAIFASIAVTNTGSRAGAEAAQLYIRYPGTVTPRAIKTLQAFAKPFLQPGETRIVEFRVPLAALRWRDPATREWKLESGTHCVLAGGSSDDAELLAADITL